MKKMYLIALFLAITQLGNTVNAFKITIQNNSSGVIHVVFGEFDGSHFYSNYTGPLTIQPNTSQEINATTGTSVAYIEIDDAAGQKWIKNPLTDAQKAQDQLWTYASSRTLSIQPAASKNP